MTGEMSESLAGWCWTAIENVAEARRLFKIAETLGHRRRRKRYGLLGDVQAPLAAIRFREHCHNTRCACHVAALWDGVRGFSRDARTGSLHSMARPFASMRMRVEPELPDSQVTMELLPLEPEARTVKRTIY